MNLLQLFLSGFQFAVSNLVREGVGLAELRGRFAEMFPGQPLPHPNTLNALIQKVRLSNDIANRINRGVRPRESSYPSVPRGVDCEGFTYRVIIQTQVPQFGQPGVTRGVRFPIQIETQTPQNLEDILSRVPAAVEAARSNRDQYELILTGISRGNLEVADVKVADAYRC